MSKTAQEKKYALLELRKRLRRHLRAMADKQAQGEKQVASSKAKPEE